MLSFYVYILASRPFGTLYVGMTDDLERHVNEHKHHVIPGFTSKYAVTTLVWFEEHGSRELAFQRERQIKKWRRRWKIELIQASNPEWDDLAADWFK